MFFLGTLVGAIGGILFALMAVYHAQFSPNHLMDLTFTLLACGALYLIGKNFHASTKNGSPIVAVALIASVMVLLLGGVIYNPTLHSLPIHRVKFNNSEISFTNHDLTALTHLQQRQHQKMAELYETSKELSPCCQKSIQELMQQVVLLDEMALTLLEKD